MNLLQKIFKPRVKYQPLIEVRIFKQAILDNLSAYKKTYPKFQFAPVLKSNAYGHGLKEVAGILDTQACPFFVVDSFYEALVLRKALIKSQILILGFVRPKEILENQLQKVAYGIIDLEILKVLVKEAKHPIVIHLKVDTGMHRQGILVEQVPEAIQLLKSSPNITLEGLCSHLADADGVNQEFTQIQIKKWNQVVSHFKQEFSSIKYLHLTNTAGAFYHSSLQANTSRLGIGLYGFNASPFENLNLQPALEMRSIITSLKTIPQGEKVGYNITYTAGAAIKIATVPVGYNEGVDRRLSNRGFVKVKNIFCPIIGRVSMNMCSVDVSEVPNIQVGDEIVVVSSQGNDKNSVSNMAEQANTIIHEILVHIPGYLKRSIR